MDKILLTAFLTVLAGFITAALSIVKLVNEKESKTTEFRQSWTDSARKALAELIAKINSQASVLSDMRRRFITLENIKAQKLDDEEAKKVSAKDFESTRDIMLKNFDASIILTEEIYHSYATVKLHFKPFDKEFAIVENKVEQCFSKLKDMRSEVEINKLLIMREQVHAAADEISIAARHLLKHEWETVKLGEPAYRMTKMWSVRGFVIMLIILFVVGVHSMLSYIESDDSLILKKTNETHQVLSKDGPVSAVH